MIYILTWWGISISIVGTGQSFSLLSLSAGTPPLWTAAREVSHRLDDRHQRSYLFRQRLCLIFTSVFLFFVSFFLLLSRLGCKWISTSYFSRDRQQEAGGETHPSPPILSSLCLTARVVGLLPGWLKSWLSHCGIWSSMLHVLIVGIWIAE